MTPNLNQIVEFLDRANKNTYAASKGKVESSRVGSTDLRYEEGDWVYHDTYFGDDRFIGEEVVYKSGVPVWGMNYYGRTLDDNFDVGKFLKQSLMQEYDDILPVRGPGEFTEGDFKYTNQVEGDMEYFEGQEKIYNREREIYNATYHGGTIK